MKKIILSLLAASILLISSCSKPATHSGNSWSFMGTSYYTTSTIDQGGGFWDIASANPSGTIQIDFSAGGLPTASGNYTVVAYGSGLSGSNKLTIYLEAADGSIYHSTGSGSSQTVNVSVTSGGRISLTGSGIEMVNTYDATDKSNLSMTVSQL